MNDSSQTEAREAGTETDTPQSVEAWEAKYKAELDTATAALFTAMGSYVEAIKQLHGYTKWREGFSDGWDASTKHFREQMEKQVQAVQGKIAGLALQQPTLLEQGALRSPPQVIPTAADLVHQFIHENPGKRGVEIAENFAKTIWQLPERTVRTALHRLKRAEKIVVVDGRWYTPEHPAATSQPTLEMETD